MHDDLIDLLTGWICMVCGANRAFDDTGVAHRPIPGAADLFPDGRVNVQHCLDNPRCVAHATAPGPWKGPPDREHP